MTKKVQNIQLNLSSPITAVKGVGPKKAESFNRLGIVNLGDILNFYPRSYEDFRNVRNICDIENEDKVLVKARVLLSNPGRGYGRKRTMHVLVEDNTGRMEVLFFMAGFLKFEVGTVYNFFGKCKVEHGRVTMFHPVYSKDEGENKGILPVYPLTRGLTQKDIRNISDTALKFYDYIPETLPESVIKDSNICSAAFSVSNIHYPKGDNEYKQAKYRLVFEELFYLKAAIAYSKLRDNSDRKSVSIIGEYAKDFVNGLSYKLTNAQSKTLDDVLGDISKNVPANRLIQGDVGSGKTVIAEAAIVQTAKNGYQTAFMAPTEILARQHFESLTKDFKDLGIRVGLLTGSLGSKEKQDILIKLKNGEIDVVIGTHALISPNVEYKNLALVITDEQHRFGVNQRMKLSSKGVNPHTLVMTATPIPRTLAVVLYADMDISIIDELPPGRIPVITKKFNSENRKAAYDLLLSEIESGRQGYIVAPLIEDSENMDRESAEGIFDDFSAKYPKIKCALLHGQMTEDEKNAIMEKFHDGSISVLISTVVIEVGINVPNASVMIIENQERFGLAQLHQLRGRVGRGKYQSYCLLVSGEESEVSKNRADIMCSTTDGFKIAEEDLKLRGPGEFFGYRQHGLPELNFADPIKHAKIAEEAGRGVSKLLADDPYLEKPENREFYENLYKKYIQLESLTL